MSESTSANSSFRTPDPVAKSSSCERSQRSGSNSRRGDASPRRDGSNERNENRGRPGNHRNNHGQNSDRNRSSSRDKINPDHWRRQQGFGRGRGPNSTSQHNKYRAHEKGDRNYDSGRNCNSRSQPVGFRDDQSTQQDYCNDSYEQDGSNENYSYDQSAQQSEESYYRRGFSRGSPQNRGRRGRQGGYGGAYYGNDHQAPGRSQQRWDEDPEVFLSKTLSSILRHNAEKFGLKLMKGGFLYVDEILWRVQRLRGFTIDDVHSVVASNDKKRFSLEEEEGRWKIRANQGHSIEVEDLDLKPILSADEVPVVIHGTYFSSWELIKKTGLNRMNRNHIHFAAGEPGNNGVISGMRKSCEVMIYINLEKALKDGLKFFISANNVILSPGDKNGVIYPCYFDGAVDRSSNYRLKFDSTINSGKFEKEKAAEEPNDNKKRKKKNKGNKNRNEDKEFEEGVKATREDVKEQETKKEPKEQENEASTDDMSHPAAKKQHLSEQVKTEQPKAECSVVKTVEPETNRDEDKDIWGDKVKSKDWLEPREVATAEESKSLMNELCDKEPAHVVVSVVGENLGCEESKIRMIVLSCYPNTYVYHVKDDNRSLITDGHLDQLLQHKTIAKVFFDIGPVFSSLLHEYDIFLDGVPIWDISILQGKVTIPDMEKEELGLKKGMAKQWKKQNEDFGKKLSSGYDPEVVSILFERGKLIYDLYSICNRLIDESLKKKIKKETFDVAIPSNGSFLEDKIKALKLERKKKGAEKPASQQPPQQQQQQNQQGKSGKVKQRKTRK